VIERERERDGWLNESRSAEAGRYGRLDIHSVFSVDLGFSGKKVGQTPKPVSLSNFTISWVREDRLAN
jgi:hypothetical protein